LTDTVQCDRHGEQDWAAVCEHIMATLQDRKPRGFCWTLDDDGHYQALCSSCEAMDDAAWERVRGQVHRIICIGCYREAASINDVVVTIQ